MMEVHPRVRPSAGAGSSSEALRTLEGEKPIPISSSSLPLELAAASLPTPPYSHSKASPLSSSPFEHFTFPRWPKEDLMHYHRHKCNTDGGSNRLIPVLESPSAKEHLQFYYHIRGDLCACLTWLFGDRARRISIQEVEGRQESPYVIVVQVEEEGTPEWWSWLEFEVFRMVVCNQKYNGRSDWNFDIRFWPFDHAAAMKATSLGIPEWMKVAAGPNMSPPHVQQTVPIEGYDAHELPPPQQFPPPQVHFDVPMEGYYAHELPLPQQFPPPQVHFDVPMEGYYAHELPLLQHFLPPQAQYGVPIGNYYTHQPPPPEQFPQLAQYGVPTGNYYAHQQPPLEQGPLPLADYNVVMEGYHAYQPPPPQQFLAPQAQYMLPQSVETGVLSPQSQPFENVLPQSVEMGMMSPNSGEAAVANQEFLTSEDLDSPPDPWLPHYSGLKGEDLTLPEWYEDFDFGHGSFF